MLQLEVYVTFLSRYLKIVFFFKLSMLKIKDLIWGISQQVDRYFGGMRSFLKVLKFQNILFTHSTKP